MENMFNSFDDVISALNAISDEEASNSAIEGNCVEKTANEVMAAYQNANKWLDSVKEAIYTKMSCPFFSSFVHELAHTMPQRFDAFGETLHTVNMEIPYPATAEIARKPATIQESFDIIFSCLDDIKTALNAFIKCTDEKYHGMACAAEACLNDIEGEYPMLYRLRDKANECGDDTVTFDKFVGQYQEHKGDLLESLKDGRINTHELKIIDGLLSELEDNCNYSGNQLIKVCQNVGMTDDEIYVFVLGGNPEVIKHRDDSLENKKARRTRI